ncbi:MAG: NAD-dependent epimerase/dehydratase family protein [Desulfobulbaceae bacterium]|nr:NAD-dependent epimerase/dehydratase family protein [Desulfobulbaceae bacterium]
MSEERFLVTGAAGYVGSNLVRLLSNRGIKVRAMVRPGGQKLEENLPGVEVVEADISDPQSLAPILEDITGVYHIAALFRQQKFPDKVFREVNTNGVQNMLEASIEAGVQRFVHCSTVGVLGHVSEPPANEETPYNPGDIYQQTKMEGELIALKYFKEGKIGGNIIRPGMVYGPGDTRNLKLFRMIANRTFFYVGKGQATVHFVDVRDLARSFVLAMEKTNVNGEIFIIAGETPLPLRDLANIIAKKCNVAAPWLKLPVKPMQLAGDLCEFICAPFGIEPPLYRRRVDFFTKDRHFNTSKAFNMLGFKAAQPLHAEVNDIIKSYRNEKYF